MNLSRSVTLPLPRLLILFLVFLAFGLRLWRLDRVPPGWRDDELINSLVISQKVLDGDWAPYYPDASGHEALYHVLNALPLWLFGPGVLGIRLLSVLLGTLTIPITYVVAKRLADHRVALLAATAMALSFWSLMYSRIGLRHILTPFLASATLYFFWRGLQFSSDGQGRGSAVRYWVLSALAMGLGFYTYFASRGVPLILAAFGAYLWLFDRPLLSRVWRGMALMFIVSGLMTLPLLLTLRQQPASEARVSELAVPLIEAREGRFGPLWEHIRVTLSMFHSDGDDEWLYNIPHRPVFGAPGSLFFWTGVALALWQALTPVFRRRSSESGVERRSLRGTLSKRSQTGSLLILWWLVGISPGFVSVPPASLGHTIVALPAVYILMALPFQGQQEYLSPAFVDRGRLRLSCAAISLLLVTAIGWRDLSSYYREWPSRGMVRFLYRADIHEVADYLNQRADFSDFSITSLLAGPWDKVALSIGLDEALAAEVRPRWYDPRRALIIEPALGFSGFPNVPTAFGSMQTPVPGRIQIGGYQLTQVTSAVNPSGEVCFENGLCWFSAIYDSDSQQLELGWQVERRITLPTIPLISNPPPPGVYAGPRLQVFGQVHDVAGNFLAGDDGLWVDPATLRPGDIFLQRHHLAVPDGTIPASAVFGLYDPMNGRRILTEDGRDHLRIEIEN